MHPSPDRQIATLLSAAGAGLVLALVGWWLVRPAAAPVEATMPLAGASASAPDAPDAPAPTPDGEISEGSASAEPEADGAGGAADGRGATLVVQAAGAVRSPGVHRLPEGSRVDDLVRAAGGFAEGADPDRVNLAAPLVDGERVWVPAVGEQEVPEVVAGAGGGSGGGGSSVPGASSTAGGSAGAGSEPHGAPVDLNRASAAELDTLPGIGPATAAAILAHRDEIGRFSSVEQLLDVRGIGDAKLEQLRPLVTV